MNILMINEWKEDGDFDVFCFATHDCENDFGFQVCLFGLGIAILFDKF